MRDMNMQTRTLIFALLVSSAATSAEKSAITEFTRDGAAMTVHSFGKTFMFPWSCSIDVGSIVLDKDILILCDSISSADVAHIYFKSAEECSVSKVLPIGNDRIKPIRESQNTAGSGVWFYEAEYKLSPENTIQYKRVAKDDEVCMIVVTSSREMAVMATEPIWE